MSKRSKILVVLVLILIVAAIGGYLVYSNKDSDRTPRKYGYVKKETITTSVEKFNKETEKMEYKAKKDFLIINDNVYWYKMAEGIHLFVVPKEFNNNMDEDITKTMGIYYTKDYDKPELALEYAKKLIKSNNPKITDKEIDMLIEDAKNVSKENKAVANGRGLSVSYVEKDDHFEYQVTRLYR